MVSVASWFYVWFNYIINIKIFILLLNNNKSVGKKSFINKNKLENFVQSNSIDISCFFTSIHASLFWCKA